MAEGKHAVVIGATGLIGWGVVNELLSAETIAPSAFNRVTALVNRPIRRDATFWPPSHLAQPRLLVVDGVNLIEDEKQLSTLLRERVPDAESITHAYFFVFRAGDGGEEEVELNVRMMRTFITALESLTSKLEFFVFPGGTRGYGIYQPGGIFTAPLTESLVSNLPESYAKTVAYPAFRRLLLEASEGKDWTWAEICPDMVVGFAPHGSGWSLAAHWAVYLSLWKMVYGEGSEVPFPGTVRGFEAKFTEASTRTLARFAIYASVLKSETCGGGRLFNVADEEGPGTMRERWPLIAAWFGLKGIAPPPGGFRGDRPSAFIEKHKSLLESAGANMATVWHTEQLDSVGYWLEFDRQLGLGRLREQAGFREESRPEDGWYKAFELFQIAGMIP